MKKIIKKLTTPLLLPSWAQELPLFVLRVACGYLLTANFGAAKFGLPWSPPENNLGFFEVAFWFPNDVAAYGGIFKMFPAFFAWMGAFAEAVGGLLLIVGFQTRIASFLICCTMLVAAFVQHAHEDIWNQLPAMAFFAVALYTMMLGSGRFGLDYLLTRNMTTDENRL